MRSTVPCVFERKRERRRERNGEVSAIPEHLELRFEPGTEDRQTLCCRSQTRPPLAWKWHLVETLRAIGGN